MTDTQWIAVAQMVTAFFTLVGVVLTVLVGRRVGDLHTQLNSRMDELLKKSEVIAHAAGVKEGKESQRGG